MVEEPKKPTEQDWTNLQTHEPLNQGKKKNIWLSATGVWDNIPITGTKI